MEEWSYSLRIIGALDGDEWSDSRPGCFFSMEITPGVLNGDTECAL
jgi:hypothetical protein